jgi:hypothetical protein
MKAKWWPIPMIGKVWLLGAALTLTGLVLGISAIWGTGLGLLVFVFAVGMTSTAGR